MYGALSTGLACGQHSLWDVCDYCSAHSTTCHVKVVDLFECLYLSFLIKNSMRVEFMPCLLLYLSQNLAHGLGKQETS